MSKFFNRQNPKNHEELWCNLCKMYHHRNNFYAKNDAPFGKRSSCKEREKINRIRIRNAQPTILIPIIKERPVRKYISMKESPLASCDRGNIKGFIKYYNNRQEHFLELFGQEYNEKNAVDAFNKLNLGQIRESF